LLNTASQLQAFVVNAAKTQSTAPPFPCSTLFGTFGAPGGSTNIAKHTKGGDGGRAPGNGDGGGGGNGD
ncbi:MAG: hypothetical protein JWO42_2985, partial [Chloroflexi bacterium]|nr:hypothetical protein [Chloroflexota bacterium]